MTDIDNEMWRIRYAEEIFPSEMSTIGQHLADEIERLRAENADLAMIIERLGKPVVNAYRWEDVKRFTDAEAENADLRARLAEVEDRLAEVEDDHSRMVEWHDQQHARAEVAEARLAEVEELLARYEAVIAAVRDLCRPVALNSMEFSAVTLAQDVLALIDQEDDRG